MSEIIDNAPAVRRPASGPGAVLFTVGGLAAAFGVASCCALPLLLTTIGVSTAWLGGVALLARPTAACSSSLARFAWWAARHCCGGSSGPRRVAGRMAPARRPPFEC